MTRSRRPSLTGESVRKAEPRAATRITTGQRQTLGSAAGLNFFRLIAEHGTDVASVHKRDGEFVFVAPTAFRLFGWRDTELLGDSLVKLCHESDQLRLQLALRVEAGSTEKVAYRVRCADGTERWVETVAQTGPTAELVVCMTRDVTEHKRTAHALERGLHTLMERAPEAMLVVQDGRVRRANAAAATLLGLREDALVGRALQGLVHPDDAAREAGDLGAVESAARGSLALHDVRFLRANGQVLGAQAFVVGVAHAGRGAALVTFHEKAQTDGEEAVLQRLRVIGTVAANLARDLADPLALIASNLEVLRGHDDGRTVPPDERHEALAEAAEASERALAALRALREFARGEPTKPKRNANGPRPTLRMPAFDPPSAGTMPPPSSRGSKRAHAAVEARTTLRAGRRPTVLIVDDDEHLGHSLRRLLRADYDIALESSAKTALKRLRGGEHYDVIVCDVMLPGMTGLELHEELQAIAPELASRMLFMSGGFAIPEVKTRLERFAGDFLDKPFSPDELRAKLRDIAARRR